MKITMLTTAAGPAGSYQAGQIYEVGVEIPNQLAQAFVAGGFARMNEKEKVEKPSPAGPLAVETAVVKPQVETAVIAQATTKKGAAAKGRAARK